MTGQPGSSRQELFRIDGSDLMDKAKQLVDEGNKHRVVVLNEEGKAVFDIPLTVAVVGGIIVFPATAVGVIAALATRHSIVVQSVEPEAATERSIGGGRAAERSPQPRHATPTDETAVTRLKRTPPAPDQRPLAIFLGEGPAIVSAVYRRGRR